MSGDLGSLLGPKLSIRLLVLLREEDKRRSQSADVVNNLLAAPSSSSYPGAAVESRVLCDPYRFNRTTTRC